MNEKPILFSASMVRAILDGSKTQTRRIVKPQPEPIPDDVSTYKGEDPRRIWWQCTPAQTMVELRDMPSCCPYGTAGDRLLVKETFSEDFKAHYPHDPIWYRADDDRAHDIEHRSGVQGIYSPESKSFVPFKWKPSIFMSRHQSRLTLEIVSVRVERLQEISEEDAKAEGVHVGQRATLPGDENRSCVTCGKHRNYHLGSCRCCPQGMGTSYLSATWKGGYYLLWESINGQSSWAQNPWVWVVEFRRIVDQQPTRQLKPATIDRIVQGLGDKTKALSINWKPTAIPTHKIP